MSVVDLAPRDSDAAALRTGAAAMPGGIAWPGVSVLVLTRSGSIADATRTSLRQQQPIEIELVAIDGRGAHARAIAEALARVRHRYAIILADGDRIARGALPMAVMTAEREGCDVTAGLRLVDGAHGPNDCDCLGLAPGALKDDPLLWRADLTDATLSTGGDLLIRADRLTTAGLARIAESREPVTTLLRTLGDAGGRLGLMGQVLLEAREAPGPGSAGRPLKILALSDSGTSGGGAAIAHRRLIEALRLAGHRVDSAALFDHSGKAAAERVTRFPPIEARLAAEDYDVVLAGNIHGATRTTDVLRAVPLPTRVAVVTHDVFMLTGRCVVPMDCHRFETGCDANCPTPDAYPELRRGRIAGAWADKRDFLTGQPAPLLLANSDWLAGLSRQLLGPAFADRVRRIDLPFPTQIFKPQDRAAVRRSLGLPPDDVLILFAAAVADEPAKGFADIVSALRDIARPGVGFVAIGRVDDPGRFELPNLITPGPIGAEADLARWFGACDIHVTASRYESLGQTPIEAGLCGTPTVAFRRTGLTTSVLDGLSGVLADPKDPGTFRDAIAALVADPGLRAAMGGWADLAFSARNSPATAAVQMHHAFAAAGVCGADRVGRIRFTPAMVESLRAATKPLPGAVGLVPPAPRRSQRLARNLKRRLFGRSTPCWLRWSVDLAGRLRRRRMPATDGESP